VIRPPSICSIGVIVWLLALPACQIGFAAEPKRVMLLHSFGRDFQPWSDYATTLRTELDRQSPWPLDIIDHSLVSARSSDENPEGPFVDYLRALFDKRPLDLIVSVGAPAAAFVQRHRHEVFARTPMIFMAVEQRRVQYSRLTENDAVVAVWINYLAAFENILRVLPDTKNVTVVVGTSPIEKFWREEIGNELEPLTGRIAITWTDHLSFGDLLHHAAALPPRSAIFWELMIVDAAGVVHEGSTPLARLHAAANAPIFSYDESFFGRAIVGGPLLSARESSQKTATVAVRILGGEKAGDIKTPPVAFAAPKFDWREMQRWGISESVLPPNSTIYFREPTAWERYRPQILGLSAALLAQAVLILWLIYEHRRRNIAEVTSRNAISELTYLNRRAAAGQLSGSIAHEVNQPLSAITLEAGTALALLKRATPDLDQVRDALEQIMSSGVRAGDIIHNLRAMFKKDSNERLPADINNLILAVLSIMRVDLNKNGIQVETQLGEQLPAVEGDKVQLQQVILNLTMNAIDAMRTSDRRVLQVRSQRSKPDQVMVSIEDTGTGIDPSAIDRIFSPLFTTKSEGMGMGLSICQSIIESHGGRIWASSEAHKGAVFHFELPTSVKPQPAV
jgi:signal transduction histidine kinase